MKKLCFSILLTLCMVLSLMPIMVFAETRPCPNCGGQFTATYKYLNSSDHNVNGSCATCGYGFSMKNSHIWDDGVIETQSTCTTAGTKIYTCTECGGKKTEEIPAGHNWDSGWSMDSDQHWKVCRTCSTKGNYAGHT